MEDLSNYSIERRLRAAMALTGVESVGELARLLDARGLGERTLRKFQDPNDSRKPRRHELDAIAKALKVPSGFLVDDEATDSLPMRIANVERLVAAMASRLPDPVDEQERELREAVRIAAQHAEEADESARSVRPEAVAP
jgi:hypothetical protein